VDDVSDFEMETESSFGSSNELTTENSIPIIARHDWIKSCPPMHIGMSADSTCGLEDEPFTNIKVLERIKRMPEETAVQSTRWCLDEFHLLKLEDPIFRLH
jgi:hypothetical protein